MLNNSHPTDLEIAECYKKDKKQGFRLLYRKYSERILSVCKRYSADKGEAMDYFQEVMLKVNDKIGAFQPIREGSLLHWMSRVAVNMITDELRRGKKLQQFVEIDSEVENISDPEYDDIVSIPVEEIYKMIRKLSPTKRTVFNLFTVEGYSYKEIGDLLGISEDGASSTMSKARKELGRMVKTYLKDNSK